MNNFNVPIMPSEEYWRPKNYLLRQSICKCQSCQEVHSTSTLWKVLVNKKHPTVLREMPIIDLAKIVDQLPMVKVVTETTQPICHLCVDILAEDLGFNKPQVINEAAWRRAIVESERAASKPKPTVQPVKTVNLGELL